MPWVNDVAAIVQAWYQGNEVGNALADVLFGLVNPSGKLPLTFPTRMEDIPAYPNLKSENGMIHYREDVFVGYKYYQMRNIKPLFPFGYIFILLIFLLIMLTFNRRRHGLSYTTFQLSNLAISEPKYQDSEISIELTVSVRNTGPVPGSEVVQVYISLPSSIGVSTPRLQLRGFTKVHGLAPEESKVARVVLDRCAVGFWDEITEKWHAKEGVYGVFAGRSSVDLPLEGKFELKRALSWTGV
jgi:beta-glucosidase